jgi:hypothetical protein
MNETIEFVLESRDGIVDCSLEITGDERSPYYSVTILYPHIVNGRLLSEVYIHNLDLDKKSGTWSFSDPESVHPKVLALQKQLSAAIGKQ